MIAPAQHEVNQERDEAGHEQHVVKGAHVAVQVGEDRCRSAKIIEEKRRKEQEEMASLRSSQVGSGDRSEKIRTYNFPQNRVTDHRIHLTLYNLVDVLGGKLDDFTQPLVAYFYEQKLIADENDR